MTTTHQLIHGDCRQMNLVPDKSVHLIITSPPYWQLKDYGNEDQIGFHDNYENYINHLNLVWKECYRVLEDGCRLCINIGDQFARAIYYGRYKVIPIRTEIIKFCESIGLDYMGAIIWQKKTTTNTTGGASLMGSYPYPRNGIISIDYEFILIFKKPGNPPKVTPEIKEASKMTKEEWKTFFSGHWYFGGAKQDGHIAVFPEELPKRLIKMFSFKGETVLDPFMGSGTTSLSASKLERNSIGYEINSDYIEIAKQKLNTAKPEKEVNFRFLNDRTNPDLLNEIEKLPYKFRDLQKMDKKTDPLKKQFGSKINHQQHKREEYFSVKEILSPEILTLNNGKTVKLIGVKIKKTKIQDAIQFLTDKTKNSKVYLKLDEDQPPQNGKIPCYLYLKNKTFLNVHLIKKGFAEADDKSNYQLKEKFLKIEVKV